MEIKILDFSYKDKNKYIFKNLNLKIKSSKITGIYGDRLDFLAKSLLNKCNYQGTILFDDNPIQKYEDNLIAYIDKISNNTFLTSKVSDEFFLIKNKVKDLEKSFIKKVTSSLNIVGLDETYLNREINTLSKSEKKLVQIALHLITNPDIIIIDEPFLYLDKKSSFLIHKVIKDLNKKYKKTILILSYDMNVLYELVSELVIFKNNCILISDSINSVFKDLNFLEENQIVLPDLVLFNKIALLYGIKLNNTKDVKDLIKDVYKYVHKTKKET